jgi:deazaflavin-dependent oxidoreductase (nitroreductase family)
VAQNYNVGLVKRILNFAMRTALHLGLAPKRYVLLTTRGRKTGKLSSTPVIVTELDGARWIVSPYGVRQWARNARSDGRVTLGRGKTHKPVRLEEVSPTEAAPVLKRYLADTPVTRPYFDVSPQSPLEAFEQEAPRHPVFRIVEAEGDAMRKPGTG